jgi:DNA polymerase-3 subunit delta'
MTTHKWPVYGHDWAVDSLRQSMATGRIRHAYLITGTPAVGKRTLAHIFAQALNCTHEDIAARPCFQCRSCRLIDSDNHPDIVYSETDPSTGALKIESIRNVTGRLALKPYEARYRIAIFHDFDHAQPRAQDALLKTLEEAPPTAILILLAESTETLMSTITSRCQMIHLRPAPVDVVRDVLLGRGSEMEQADLMARLSGGRIGWALAALRDPAVLEQRAQALDLLENYLQENRAGRFALAEGLGKDKLALRPLLELWLTYWRDLLLLTEDSPVKPCNSDRLVAMQRLAVDMTPEEALRALQATQRTLDQLKWNLNTRLAVEVLFLEYPGLAR